MYVMNPFVELISTVIQLYAYVVWGWVILSLLISFEIVNRRQPAVQRINYALFKLTDPPLRRIRKYMPDLGGIDISPWVLLLLLKFIDSTIVYYSYRL